MASEGQDRAHALGWGRGFTPTDLRPSLANRTIPHKSYRCFYLRQRAGVLRDLIQDPADGLRRILLPRTLVGKVAGGPFLWENVWRGNNGGWIQWLASARRRPMPRGCSSARTPCRPRQTVSSSSSNFRRCWDEPDALSGWAAQCPG